MSARVDLSGLLRIGELARRAGVRRGTIQHYIREGLLPPPRKTGRNMGYYDPSCVERIQLVQRLQGTRYLPLAEIRKLLGEGGTPGAAAAMLDAQRAALASLSDPGTTPSALTPTEASRTLGVAPDVIERLRELRLVEPRGPTGREKIEGPDLEVLVAIAHLKQLGFDEEAGFEAAELATYRRNVERLVHGEIETFLRVIARGGGRARRKVDPVKLARSAVQAATLLIVALRKKLIADLLALHELPRDPRARRARARRRSTDRDG